MTRTFEYLLSARKPNEHDSPVEITTFGTPHTGISGRVGRTGHVGGKIRRVCSGVTVNKVEKKDISPRANLFDQRVTQRTRRMSRVSINSRPLCVSRENTVNDKSRPDETFKSVSRIKRCPEQFREFWHNTKLPRTFSPDRSRSRNKNRLNCLAGN